MDAMKLINNLCEGYNAAADEPAMPKVKHFNAYPPKASGSVAAAIVCW